MISHSGMLVCLVLVAVVATASGHEMPSTELSSTLSDSPASSISVILRNVVQIGMIFGFLSMLLPHLTRLTQMLYTIPTFVEAEKQTSQVNRQTTGVRQGYRFVALSVLAGVVALFCADLLSSHRLGKYLYGSLPHEEVGHGVLPWAKRGHHDGNNVVVNLYVHPNFWKRSELLLHPVNQLNWEQIDLARDRGKRTHVLPASITLGQLFNALGSAPGWEFPWCNTEKECTIEHETDYCKAGGWAIKAGQSFFAQNRTEHCLYVKFPNAKQDGTDYGEMSIPEWGAVSLAQAQQQFHAHKWNEDDGDTSPAANEISFYVGPTSEALSSTLHMCLASQEEQEAQQQASMKKLSDSQSKFTMTKQRLRDD